MLTLRNFQNICGIFLSMQKFMNIISEWHDHSGTRHVLLHTVLNILNSLFCYISGGGYIWQFGPFPRLKRFAMFWIGFLSFLCDMVNFVLDNEFEICEKSERYFCEICRWVNGIFHKNIFQIFRKSKIHCWMFSLEALLNWLASMTLTSLVELLSVNKPLSVCKKVWNISIPKLELHSYR